MANIESNIHNMFKFLNSRYKRYGKIKESRWLGSQDVLCIIQVAGRINTVMTL